MSGVEIKTNRSQWKQMLDRGAESGIDALAEQMLADSTDFVPYSNSSRQSAGQLRESGHIEKGESGTRYLVWNTVYALYQWFGVRADGTHRVRNYSTPNTGTEWVEKAKKIYGDDWQKVFENGFREGMK